MPGLRNQTHFVNTYLTKLQPNPDLDWRNDPAEKKAFLARLWDYVDTLAPVHNSLKAHVLYHRLEFDRTQGVYDKDRFLAYLKLPAAHALRHPAIISAAMRTAVILATCRQIFTPSRCIRPSAKMNRSCGSYLAHFFQKETGWKAYESYVNDLYLKHLFAETKIVNGLGDEEQWASLLPPEMFQALKERIDLDFAPTNKTHFAPDDVVSLDLDVKNVQHADCQSFRDQHGIVLSAEPERDRYRHQPGWLGSQLRTNPELYAEPPLRRVRRHFEFPKLTGRGVFVIDFIGNGKSSRVLVRKGRLHYLVRTSVAGQVFTVLDEKNEIVPDAQLWLGGHEYHRRQKRRRSRFRFPTAPAGSP